MSTEPKATNTDYIWTTELGARSSPRMSPEDVLRETWEGGPKVVEQFLQVAWRFGLGLRLRSRTAVGQVSGWPVTQSDPGCIAVAVDSRLMRAGNSLTVTSTNVIWTTTVSFRHPVGRLLWMPARRIHEWLIPRSLARAVRQPNLNE